MSEDEFDSPEGSPIPLPSISIPPSRGGSDFSVDEHEACIQATIDSVDWEALAEVGRHHYQAASAVWGEQICGGYNVVRFLHLDDDKGTTIVARIPIHPIGGLVESEGTQALSRRIQSEVASMEYVLEKTSIAVPRVVAYSAELSGGGVGSPYLLITMIEGSPLSSLWDDMSDVQRDAVLKQVVDILLQLSDLRFNSIGALMKDKDSNYYISPLKSILSDEAPDPRVSSGFPNRTFSSGLDYWTAYANAALERTDEENFGQESKTYGYCMTWIQRSLFPAVINSSLDVSGFPLVHGDFHSQNIMIVDGDTSLPVVSGIIDWELTSTDATSVFAQYPLFIVDHPAWPDDHPLKLRNVRDQEVFRRLVAEAEVNAHSSHVRLANSYATCRGVYCLTQCIQSPIWDGILRDMFEHFFGKDVDETEDFAVEYYQALMRGILKAEADRFDEEMAVLKEAKVVLGEHEVPIGATRQAMRAFLAEQQVMFPNDSVVRRWSSRI